LPARRLIPVLVLAGLLGLANLVGTPALWPVDETSHVAYADHLLRARALPTIDTPIPEDLPYSGMAQRLAWERLQHRDGRQDTWTSNHPPLPSTVQAVALAAGGAAGGGWLALVLARLTSTAWLLVGVWATAHLALLLAPADREEDHARLRREDVAVLAATVVAVTPTLAHLAGVVFNDVPAFALSTLCLLVGARAAADGLTPRRLALAGALAGAAALTRVSCLPAVAVMAALCAYAWWRRPAPVRTRSGAAAALLWVVALVPAAAFWLRNRALYGSVTASSVLFDKFGRDLNDPLAVLLPDPDFWQRLWNRMWGDLTTGHWSVGIRTTITEALLSAVLAALLLAVVRGGVRLLRRGDGGGRARPARRARPPSGGDPAWLPAWVLRRRPLRRAGQALAGSPRAVTWAVVWLLPAALLVSTVQFHSAGGSLHGRYLLGGHAVTATGLVLLLAGVPRVGRLLALLLPLPLFAVGASLTASLLVHGPAAWDRRGLTMRLPHLFGPASPRASQLLLGAAALVLVLVCAQHARRPEAAEGPATEADEVDVRVPEAAPAGA
jgi:hypothetical protein